METLIATPLIDLLDFSTTQDPWKAALQLLMKQQQIDPYKLESLIAPLKASTPSQNELVTAAFFLSLNEGLRFALKSDMIALCEGMDAMPREMVLMLLGHASSFASYSFSLAKPEELLYFGMVALLENSLEKKRMFLQKVGQLTLILDRKGNPFFGLISEEKHFCLASLLATFYLIFFLAKQFSSQKQFGEIADHIYHRLGLLDGHYLDAIPAHLLMISLLITMHEEEEKCSFPIPFPSGFFREEALFHKQLAKIDFSCQFAGKGASFAAVSKGNIEIVAIAPQKLPLGVMENFGFYRHPMNEAGEGSDIQHEDSSVSGWIKLCQYGTDLPEPGNQWLHMDVKSKPDYLTLTLSPHLEMQDLYLTFFVKAREAKIEGKSGIKPRSLERIREEVREIFFKDADEILSIQFSTSVKIEVIPLAGGNHFFSANYLVAMPIQGSLSLEIS